MCRRSGAKALRVVVPSLLTVALVCVPAFSQIAIKPSAPPVVLQGQTLRFTAGERVTWSLAPGSPGAIDPDGTYHAPASVVPNQSVGGCQVYPNNNIYNTPV